MRRRPPRRSIYARSSYRTSFGALKGPLEADKAHLCSWETKSWPDAGPSRDDDSGRRHPSPTGIMNVE